MSMILQNLNFKKEVKLITAYTNCLIYKSGATIINLTGVNNYDYFNYDPNTGETKYNPIDLNNVHRERKFLFCLLYNSKDFNKNKFYLTGVEDFDSMDLILEKENKKKIIEIKFRTCKSTAFKTDFLLKDKYDRLFDSKKYYSFDEVFYINIFTDNIYRCYKLDDLELDFCIQKEIPRTHKSSVNKLAINCELDKSMLYSTGKINFI